jgi:hypothetical protein
MLGTLEAKGRNSAPVCGEAEGKMCYCTTQKSASFDYSSRIELIRQIYHRKWKTSQV